MNNLIFQALKKEKPRIATKQTAASKLKRLESKKKRSLDKQNRQKVRKTDY
jgi:ribosome-associated protein